MAADPEIQTSRVVSPLALSWRDRLTVFGVLRLVMGHVRDSTNRPNNMLAMLYAAMLVFAVVMVRVSAPCPTPTVTGGAAASAPASSAPPRVSLPLRALAAQGGGLCSPSLPPAFYYALVAPIVLFLGGYLLRHPEIRGLVERFVEAKWGQARGGSLPPSDTLNAAVRAAWGKTEAATGGGAELLAEAGKSIPPAPPPPAPFSRD